MFDWLPVLGGIILVDLVLSGDNALIIGAVAASIPAHTRWIAFLVGGGGAIVLRILLTYCVTILLQFPYLETLGGLLLLFITIRLLKDSHISPSTEQQSDEAHPPDHVSRFRKFATRHKLLGAMLTILAADATMSLDNIVAIAALAKEQPLLLIVGLCLSILLLLLGSALVSTLIGRAPWILLIAACVLTITASNMIIHEDDIYNIFPNTNWWAPLIYVLAFAVISYPAYLWWQHQYRPQD